MRSARLDLSHDRVWREAYRALADALPGRAAGARPILTGFAACIDKRVDLHRLAPHLAEVSDAAGRRFFDELMTRASAGRGGEILVDWLDGPAFLDAYADPDRIAVGGTSAQAAWALARLRAPVIMALGDRSAEQLAVLDPGICLVRPDGIAAPVDQAAAEGRGKPAHYIIEYNAGRPLPGVTPPRSTRVIVRFADEDIERDPAFRAYGRRKAGASAAALMSSPNALPPDRLTGALADLAEAAGEWRNAGIGLVHLELGDFAWPGTRDTTLARLSRVVTSLGLNLNELRALAGAPGGVDVQAVALAERVGVSRVVVHADDWALAATRGDPLVELEAVATGCLLASARAAAGAPVAVPYVPVEATFTAPPAPPRRRHCEEWSVVCCPAPHLTHPRSSVGLGDTFAAGFLLAHSFASPQAVLGDIAVMTGETQAGAGLASAGCLSLPSP
jgi:ADP-dependent phosphofructokinase/glucokinase